MTSAEAKAQQIADYRRQVSAMWDNKLRCEVTIARSLAKISPLIWGPQLVVLEEECRSRGIDPES